MLRDTPARAARVAHEHADRFGASPRFVYRHAVKGYAARMTAAAAAQIARDPRVELVEPDRELRVLTTQTSPTWGLDRIDQRRRLLNTRFTYTNTGAGVTVYVIDTGIRSTHQEVVGRVDTTRAFDAVVPPLLGEDCNGHGTHVAGTVGGSTYGVAKDVTLVSVRVLNCTGAGLTSWVIAGIDYVTADHDAGEAAVANVSLGGAASPALDQAVGNSIADGVSYAIAAGNSRRNACNESPARVGAAMTVSASNRRDTRPSWANYGRCVDWFAPGAGITSAWATSDSATNTISGTSMATPHTAGVAALYLHANPSATPSAVRSALYSLTTKGVVKSANTRNNHLLFTRL